MRPGSLSEFIGQEHLLGEGSALRTALEEGHPHSMILYGPPGTGKTTLARLLALNARAAFEEASAVNAGRQEVRDVLERAEHRRRTSHEGTIFFLDEIHRFNKAQQDALLPAVEEGLVALVGATTENPYFEVNSALLSRCTRLRVPLARGRARARPAAPCADRRARRAGRAAGGRRCPRVPRGAGRGRRPDRPRRARRGLRDRRQRSRHAPPCGGRAPAQGAALRQGRRPPLRHDLRLDQGHPRLRPGRVDALPGGDAGGRRGPALHRPPDGHSRQRGRGQRGPARARGGGGGGARGRARGHAGVRVQPRAGGDLPLARAEVGLGQASARRHRGMGPAARGAGAARLPAQQRTTGRRRAARATTPRIREAAASHRRS